MVLQVGVTAQEALDMGSQTDRGQDSKGSKFSIM